MSKLSTLVFTHRIYIKINKGHMDDYRLTEKEAVDALAAWNDKRPVPVPNSKDPERSIMYFDPFSVFQIKRYKR